ARDDIVLIWRSSNHGRPGRLRAGEWIVELILGAECEQGREVSVPFGSCRYGQERSIRLAVVERFPGEKPEQLVAAVVDLRQDDGSADGGAELIVVRYRIPQAGAIVEEIIRRESIRLIELVERAVDLVGAALDDLVQCAAAGVTVSSVAVECLHARFEDGILG